MTVKELIAKLQEYPDKFEVVIAVECGVELNILDEDIIYCQENKQVILQAYV